MNLAQLTAINSLEQLLAFPLVIIIHFLKAWWWLIAPIVFFFLLRRLYLWWMNWDYWYPRQKWVLLEITPPKEILTPLKAMEDFFNAMWTVYDFANWRERWCEGELPEDPFWFSCEIASIEGKIHFYIRCQVSHRHIVESNLYSHYPEVEISEVPDYVKNVPQDIPNEEWDLYASDQFMAREDFYPIKTYVQFFEPSGQIITKEEKRIDPIISLLEGMGRLKAGEQTWMQIVVVPVTDRESSWRKDGERTINKIARRPQPQQKNSGLIGIIYSVVEGIGESIGQLVHGSTTSLQKKEKEKFASSEDGEREMVMTPGEKEIMIAIENKIKQYGYRTYIRGMYLAKRDAFTSNHRKIIEGYFPHFATSNLNYIRFLPRTRTKIQYILRERRNYFRKRRMFRLYQERFAPMYPKRKGLGTFILSPEELATIFHFPTKLGVLVAPTAARVEHKKGGPPTDLPVE